MADTADQTAPLASLKEVRDFFSLDGKQMVVQWRDLSDADKTDLRTGIGNGTLTY